MDVVGSDNEVGKNELRRLVIIGMNPADFGRGDDGGVGLFSRIERLDGGLRGEVKLLAGAQDKRDARLALKTPHERTADHAVMTCDKELHGFGSFAICASRFARSRSASTMIFTSSLKRTFGLQPSCLAALAGSPMSRSTSAGRS